MHSALNDLIGRQAAVSVGRGHHENVSQWNGRHVPVSSVHAAVIWNIMTVATDTSNTPENVVTSVTASQHRYTNEAVNVAVNAAEIVTSMNAAAVNSPTVVASHPTPDVTNRTVTVDPSVNTRPAALVVIRAAGFLRLGNINFCILVLKSLSRAVIL